MGIAHKRERSIRANGATCAKGLKALKGHLYLPFPAKRNGTERNRYKKEIDTTLLSERAIFVSFDSVGSYRRSFSIKLQLSIPIGSGFLG
uniref:Uncharacterized protein n=1 Tax=Romanomermis culicivorax TaxID=13658 RepID=A0A915JIJ3_ROMCU